MEKSIRIDNMILGNGNTIVNIINANGQTLPENNLIVDEYVDDNITRTRQIVDQIERFLKKYSKALSKPYIRCYGLFSDLAMVKNILTDTSDRAFLLKEEKDIFKSSIKEQFLIKQIISLDVYFTLSTRGYSIDKFDGRTEELIGELKYYENDSNLQIAFDYKHRNCNTFILGNELLIDAIDIDQANGYTTTLFSNDPLKITNKVKQFDSWFDELVIQKKILMSQLGLSDTFGLCEELVMNRKRKYIKNNS